MSSTNDPLAFISIERHLPEKREAESRNKDFADIYQSSPENELAEQAGRCIDCGNPYCQWQCPLHNHIPNWLELVRRGKLEMAAKTMLQTNPLPEICGRVCPQDRLCEKACTLNTGFGAVTIGNIEKQISDLAIKNNWYDLTPAPSLGWKVAIIGSGPAGLGCADYLSRQGIKVNVYEKYPQIGGLLTFGIPEFKLDKVVLDKRRKILEQQGINFITSTEVGKDISFDILTKEHDAIFLGMGAYRPVDGGLMDTNNPNIIPALEYLIGVTNHNHQFKVTSAVYHDLKGKDVMVFGGGDTAMDCVRTAIRQGANSVQCIYRRSENEMPGSKREVQSAKEEGVAFQFHLQPIKIRQNGERLKVDAEQRDTKDAIELDCDIAIIAFGFQPQAPNWLIDMGIEIDQAGRVKTFTSETYESELAQRTSVANLYVGGDMSRGADLVVTAIADGRKAAEQILWDLQNP